jgi:hypothetical protein
VRKTSSKPATNFESRSRIRNLTSSSAPERLRLRACWVTQRLSGFAVMPARWTRRVCSSMKNSTGVQISVDESVQLRATDMEVGLR